jgi:sporulation protein YlmC with PRC-barrel domain
VTTRLVKGTPIISLADGSKLGAIDHVYFDPERLAVVGFTFHKGGLFGGGTSGLVEIADVHAFGPDAVTITDISVVHCDLALEAKRGDLIDLEELLKRKVMTESGMHLGHVGAIQFGDASHRLTSLDVIAAGSSEHGSIPADEIQAIGDELIIVADPSAVTAANEVHSPRGLRVVTARPADSRDDRQHRNRVVISA